MRGDRYSAEWVVRAFKDAGITYKAAEKIEVRNLLEALPLFTRAGISIPDHAPLLRELAAAGARRPTRAAATASTIRATAPTTTPTPLCGAAVLARKPGYNWDWVTGPNQPVEEPQEKAERVRKLVELLKRGEPLPF